MTRDDILALDWGDSILLLEGDTSDEFPVVAVGATVFKADGTLVRPVHVRRGRANYPAIVREGDQSIRSARL